MASGDDRSDESSYALTFYERKTLAEARSYSKKCGNKIGEDKTNFADKSVIGLWWDAKGFFNCSDADDVTAHMERYRQLYEEIDEFSAKVERGDPKSYERLLKIYGELEEKESEARRDVENNQSSAVCQMLREFLDKKFNLDHNLKKVECVVLKQKMNEVEQTCKSSKNAVREMSKKMDTLIERKNSEMETFMEAMREEKKELAVEAERRAEAVRLESDEKLKQLLKEAELNSEERFRKMKEENDALRSEAEKIRRESDERLRKAVEEANSRSEARLKEVAEQNRASLQDMMKMLEAIHLPPTNETTE